ncbi:MAG: flagellin [Pseudomonadota bacterium]|jgi:flagellin
MAINIRTNLPALVTQRMVNNSSERLNQSYQRLASGLRINKASDDAAGLAIAENLRADSTLATVAIRNANDGISVIAIAEQAIGQIGNILNRLSELAQQSANGVYDSTQRSALQNEFTALTSEIERIAVTTAFNGINLISSGESLVFQVGFDGSSLSQLGYTGINATLQAIGMAVSGSSASTFSISGATDAEAQDASRSALEAISNAVAIVGRNRGRLGALESRLSASISNLQVARENFKAAESQIRDLDVASEASELTRLNILQQAGAALLAQANQQPAIALQLLGR